MDATDSLAPYPRGRGQGARKKELTSPYIALSSLSGLCNKKEDGFMPDATIPIGQVKRDISDLVNQIAYGGKRIIITSRDKPKAALVSMEDYQRLQQEGLGERLAQWQNWIAETDTLVAEILARRGGQLIPVDDLLREDREELEERSA
jgi:prevent-host-death family protein